MATITDERRPLAELKQNAKNYVVHRGPAIERIATKIRLNAFTNPFLITPDGTILAGHLRRLGLLKLRDESYSEPQGVDPGWLVPCRVFEGTETQELAILAGDNTHPSEIEFDNEALSSLLAELQADGALEGSGYDAEALDRLIGELAEQGGGEYRSTGGGVDANAEWNGMPEFDQPDTMPFRTLNVHFADEEAAQDFAALIEQDLTDRTKYVWHPEQKPQNRLGLQYVADEP